MQYIKFQVPNSNSFLVLQPIKVITDRWIDGRQTWPSKYMPPQLEVEGIKSQQGHTVLSTTSIQRQLNEKRQALTSWAMMFAA